MAALASKSRKMDLKMDQKEGCMQLLFPSFLINFVGFPWLFNLLQRRESKRIEVLVSGGLRDFFGTFSAVHRKNGQDGRIRFSPFWARAAIKYILMPRNSQPEPKSAANENPNLFSLN